MGRRCSSRCSGTPHSYSAGSQDVNNRFAASQLLYGTQVVAPIPDLARTDLLVIIGANPVVSHGSVVTAPRIKDQLHAIVDRGGRVVVVDPRRTETAEAFDWLPITPDGDALLLLAMLQILFEEGLARHGAGRQPVPTRWRALAAPFTPEAAEPHTGIDPDSVRELARDLATTERAAVYGRTGTCLGRCGTLTTFLLDAVNLVTGNLDREGGAMFGDLGIPGLRTLTGVAQRLLGLGYGKRRSRIGGFPTVLGHGARQPDGEGDHDARQGPDAGAVRLGRQPGALGPERRRARARARRARPAWSRSTSTSTRPTPTPTTSCPPRRCTSARTSRSPSRHCRPRPSARPRTRVVEPAGEAREEWTVIDELMRGLWRASPGLRARWRRGRCLRVPTTPPRA